MVQKKLGGHHDRDRMGVEFTIQLHVHVVITTTDCEFQSRSWRCS
jgi:hypothetical protein